MGRANGGKPKEPKKAKKKIGKKSVGKRKISQPTSTHKSTPPAKPIVIPCVNVQESIEQAESKKPATGPLQVLTESHMYWCKRYVLTGRNASKTARETGFSEGYSRDFLANDALILQQVERYAKQRAKRFEVNADRITAELVKVAFGTLGDFITVTRDGTPIINCSEIGEEEMAALSEITQDTYSDMVITSSGELDSAAVKKTKIKMHSKLDALRQLTQIFRMVGLDVPDPDKDQSPAARAAQLRQLLRDMINADGA